MTSGLSGSPAETRRRTDGSGRSSVRLASTRYSVGAWQTTFTPSRSISSRRSPASKRPSTIIAAAPQSHGARKTLRADFDQPVAVVHQTSSPGSAPSQCTACARWPGQVALRVQRGARLAGGARGEDDERRVVGGEVGDLGGVSWGRSSSRAARDVGHRHVVDPARQLAEQLLVADAELGVRHGGAARGRPGAAGCCTAAPRRPCASRRAGSAPTRSGCRRASSPGRRGARRAPRTPPRAPPTSRSAHRSATRAGRRRRRSRAAPAWTRGSPRAGPRSGSRRSESADAAPCLRPGRR